MLSSFAIGSILVGIALLVVVVLFLLRPILVPDPEDKVAADEENETIETLLVQKARLLKQLRLLDEDMEAGKIAPELYRHERPQLVRAAAVTMQELDSLGYSDSPSVIDEQTDARIEAAVAAVRSGEASAPDSAGDLDAQLEAAIAATRATRQTAPANGASFCPQCGRRVDPDDHFCASCGHDLTAGDPSPQQAAAT